MATHFAECGEHSLGKWEDDESKETESGSDGVGGGGGGGGGGGQANRIWSLAKQEGSPGEGSCHFSLDTAAPMGPSLPDAFPAFTLGAAEPHSCTDLPSSTPSVQRACERLCMCVFECICHFDVTCPASVPRAASVSLSRSLSLLYDQPLCFCSEVGYLWVIFCRLQLEM